MSYIVPDNSLKFRELAVARNSSPSCRRLHFHDNFIPDVANDVVTGEIIEEVVMDVLVKFDCSKSSRLKIFFLIRSTFFVYMNDVSPKIRLCA